MNIRNNRGVAISTILYMLVAVFGVVLISFMSVLVNDNSINRGIIDTIKQTLGVGNLSELDVNVQTEYRYIQADGSYSSWIEYANKSDIDLSPITITKIPNMGSMKTRYDLTATNVTLDITDGIASLEFNGTSSKGDGTTNETGAIVNTLYVDGVYNATGDMFISFDNTSAFLFNTDLDFSAPNGSYRTQMTSTVTTTERFKAVIVWGCENGVYNIYVDGIKKTSEISGLGDHSYPFEYKKVTLGYGGYATNYYLDGSIYDMKISSKRISESEAISLTSGDVDSSDILDSSNSELIYGDFIEYREVIEDTTPATIAKPVQNVTYTQYIRDYILGSSINSGNHWVEIDATVYLADDDVFHGVTVGGSYTSGGSYVLNTYNSAANDGEITVAAGTFLNHKGTSYTLALQNITTDLEGTTVSDSALIMFTGSDESRFTTATDHSKSFLMVKYIDGQWYYYTNSNTGVTFTPNSNDSLIGYVEKAQADAGLSNGELFKYPIVFNIALGKDVSGSAAENPARPYSRIVDGDATTIDLYAQPIAGGGTNQYVEIDLGTEFPIKNVNSLHYFNDARTYYDTVTELYGSGYSSKSILNNYLVDGLYKEMLMGATFQVKEQEQAADDTTAPITPGTPDLLATDDTGISSTDNKTKDLTVTVSGSGAEPYSTVYVYNGASNDATTVATSSGTWSSAITLTANTTNSITVNTRDAAGNYSSDSSALSIVADTTLPTISVSKSPTSWSTGCITQTPSSSDSGGSGLYSTTAAACKYNGTFTYTATDYAGNSKSVDSTVSRRTEYQYIDKYLEMDGNDYLKTTSTDLYGLYINDGADDFVFQIGVTFSSLSTNFYFFDQANDSDPRFALWFRASSQKIVVYHRRSGTTYIDQEMSACTLTTGVYYYIILHGGSSADRGYQVEANGTVCGKTGSAYRFGNSAGYTRVGARYTNTDLLKGNVYWFRFYGRAIGANILNYYWGTDLSTASAYWYGRNNGSSLYRFQILGTGPSEVKTYTRPWSTSANPTCSGCGYFRTNYSRYTYL